MASGREPRIYRTFDLHARLQSQQQPPLLRITCAAVTTVPGVDPHVDADFTLLWCAYGDGSVAVTDARAASAETKRGNDHQLESELARTPGVFFVESHPTEKKRSASSRWNSAPTQPLSSSSSNRSTTHHHHHHASSFPYAVQLVSMPPTFPSLSDDGTSSVGTPLVLAVDNVGSLWTLSLLPTPNDKHSFAVVSERLVDPAAVGLVATCVSFVPAATTAATPDQNRSLSAPLSFFCGCRGGVVLEWGLTSNSDAPHGYSWEVLRHILNPADSSQPAADCTALFITPGPPAATPPCYFAAVGYQDGRVTMVRVLHPLQQQQQRHDRNVEGSDDYSLSPYRSRDEEASMSPPSSPHGRSPSDIACVWYAVVFPGTWAQPTASTVTALHITFADSQQQQQQHDADAALMMTVWCGSSRGRVGAIDGHGKVSYVDDEDEASTNTVDEDDDGERGDEGRVSTAGSSRQHQRAAQQYQITGFCNGDGDDDDDDNERHHHPLVWSGGGDGKATVYDSSSLRSLVFPHPDAVASVLRICPSGRDGTDACEVWAIGECGMVLCFSSSKQHRRALSSEDSDDDATARLQSTCDQLGSMLDDAVSDLKISQDERARLLRDRSTLQQSIVGILFDAEKRNRAFIASSWADSLEIMFVQFLLTTNALQRLLAECDAVRSERDHFREMLAASASAAAASTTGAGVEVDSSIVLSSTTRSPVTALPPPTLAQRHQNQIAELMLGRTLLESPLEWTSTTRSSVDMQLSVQQQQLAAQHQQQSIHNAQIVERDAQIVQLQNELLRMRSDTDRHVDMAQQGYHRELQALRNIVQDQRRAADMLRDDIAVKSSLLDDTRKELRECKDALRASDAQHKTALEQLAHTAATQSATEKRGLTTDLLASHVELQEAQLALQQQQKAHEAERQRLQQDMLSMRAPWAAMKKALHDTQVELELVKEQASRRVQLHQNGGILSGAAATDADYSLSAAHGLPNNNTPRGAWSQAATTPITSYSAAKSSAIHEQPSMMLTVGSFHNSGVRSALVYDEPLHQPSSSSAASLRGARAEQHIISSQQRHQTPPAAARAHRQPWLR